MPTSGQRAGVVVHRDRRIRREQVEPADHGDQVPVGPATTEAPSRRRASWVSRTYFGRVVAVPQDPAGVVAGAAVVAELEALQPEDREAAAGQLGGRWREPSAPRPTTMRSRSASAISGNRAWAAASDGCRRSRPPSARTSRASTTARTCLAARTRRSPSPGGSPDPTGRRRPRGRTPGRATAAGWEQQQALDRGCGPPTAAAARRPRRGPRPRESIRCGWHQLALVPVPLGPVEAGQRARGPWCPVIVNVQAPSRCGTPAVPVDAGAPATEGRDQPGELGMHRSAVVALVVVLGERPCSWRRPRSRTAVR